MVLMIKDSDKETFVKDFITEQGLLDEYNTRKGNLKRQGNLDDLGKLSDMVTKAKELAGKSRALFIDSYCRVYNGNGIFVCVVAYSNDRHTMLKLIKAEYQAIDLG